VTTKRPSAVGVLAARDRYWPRAVDANGTKEFSPETCYDRREWLLIGGSQLRWALDASQCGSLVPGRLLRK
jgi:hypothetical protein